LFELVKFYCSKERGEMSNRAFSGIFVSLLLIGMFFLIPLSASAIPRSTASPGLTDRNVQVWKNEALDSWLKLIAMSADGRYIAAISERGGYYYEAILVDENNVTVWKFSVGDAFPDPQHVDEIDWISISDDGNYVAFGGIYWNGTDDLGYAYLFNQQGQIWNKTGFYSSQGFDILVQGELSGDGSRLVLNYVVASFLGNFSVEVYNTGRFSGTPGQFMWRYDTGDIRCDSVSISFAGDYVALGCDGAVFLVQAPAAGVHEGILVWRDDNDGENFWPIRISADGK
jgi:hypothetical protein